MATENIWQRAIALTDLIFQATSGLALDVPRNDPWPKLVIVSLSQAHERLNSIRGLLDKNYWDSSVILTRSLFEISVSLAYIARNVQPRLSQYLKHGGIPTTKEEAERLQREMDTGDQPQVKDIVPGQAWKRLKDMCCDLGSDWLREYEGFYRYASVPTHAGAFTLGKNYKQLLEQRSPSDHEKAVVLKTAASFHLRVAEIATRTFPPIDLTKIQRLQSECDSLGKQLAQEQKRRGNS